MSSNMPFGTYTYLAKITTVKQGQDAMKGVISAYTNASLAYQAAAQKLQSANEQYENAFMLYGQVENSIEFQEAKTALQEALREYESAKRELENTQSQAIQLRELVSTSDKKEALAQDLAGFEQQISTMEQTLGEYETQAQTQAQTAQSNSLELTMALNAAQQTQSATTVATNTRLMSYSQANSSTDLTSQYTYQNGWSAVAATANKNIFGTVTSYTYTTSNGSTIQVPAKNGVTVKQNSKGEIVIWGAKEGTSITLSDGANINVINSQVKNITAKGSSTVKIKGEYANVAKFTGTKGSQSISLSDGAFVDEIKTGDYKDYISIYSGSQVNKINSGKENDSIYVSNSTVGTIDTGDGNDYVTITQNSTMAGDVKTGKGNDTVTISNSTVTKQINTGNDNDSVNITNSTINGSIAEGSGNNKLTINNSKINNSIGGADNITINNSTMSSSAHIDTGSYANGEIHININNSKLDGAINLNSWYSRAFIDVANNSTANFTNVRNDDTTDVKVTNSNVGGIEHLLHPLVIGDTVFEPEANATINVTPLNTSKGSEWEGYQLLQPAKSAEDEMAILKLADGSTKIVKKQDVDKGYYPGTSLLTTYYPNVFRLPDGSVIKMDNTNGQVYRNPQTGAIVVNCAVNASITSSSNITVINSSISSHNMTKGVAEYRNSTATTVSSSNSAASQLKLNNSTAVNVMAFDSDFTLNLAKNSSVENVSGYNSSKLYITADGGNITKIQGTKDTTVRINTEGGVKIGTIEAENGLISGNLNSANVTSITSKSGRISLTGTSANIGSITNKTKDNSTTYLNFTTSTIGEIKSNAASTMTFKECNLTSVTTSDHNDTVTLIDTNVSGNVNTGKGTDKINMTGGSAKNVKTQDGNDTVIINGSKITENLENQGSTTIYGAQINHALAKGDIAIQASDINTLGAYSNGIDNIYVKNSSIGTRYYDSTDKVYESQFNIPQPRERQAKEALETSAYNKLLELTGEEKETIDNFINQPQYPEEVIALYQALGLPLVNNTINEAQFKAVLLQQMDLAIQTLVQDFHDDKISRGIGGEIVGIFTDPETQAKIDRLNATYLLAKNSNDLMTIVDAYKVITKDTDTIKAVAGNQNAINYANSISKEDKLAILDTLDMMINALEYSAKEENGAIKNILSVCNKFLDIGTNENEVKAKISTLRSQVESLRQGIKNGTITTEDFCARYKSITGYDFTQENIQTLSDNIRGNNNFKNGVQDVIQCYKDTQQTIFQVGEYIVVIAAGVVVSMASCGAAGPAVTAGLSSLGKMGVALTATTVTAVTKNVIEIVEKNTDKISANNVTPEQVARSFALMYAGCISGQIGGCVGEMVKGFFESELDDVILGAIIGKLADLAVDTGICYATTTAITGSSDLTEEFWQNVQGWIIGSITSRISGYYYEKHKDEIELSQQIYNARKEMKAQGLSVEEQSIRLLAMVGLDTELATKAGYKASDIDALVMAQRLKMDIPESQFKLTEGAEVKPEGTEAKPEGAEVKPENSEIKPEGAEVNHARMQAIEELGVDEKYVSALANMDDETFKVVQDAKRFNDNFHKGEFDFEKAIALSNKGMTDSFSLSRAAGCDDAAYSRLLSLLDSDYTKLLDTSALVSIAQDIDNLDLCYRAAEIATKDSMATNFMDSLIELAKAEGEAKLVIDALLDRDIDVYKVQSTYKAISMDNLDSFLTILEINNRLSSTFINRLLNSEMDFDQICQYIKSDITVSYNEGYVSRLLDAYDYCKSNSKDATFSQQLEYLYTITQDILTTKMDSKLFTSNDIKILEASCKEITLNMADAYNKNGTIDLDAEEKFSVLEHLYDAQQNKLNIYSSQEVKSIQSAYRSAYIDIAQTYKQSGDGLTFKQKLEIISKLSQAELNNDLKIFSDEDLAMFRGVVEDIQKSLNHTITPTQITSDNMAHMMSGFFANNNTSLENMLKTTDFTQFGKEGLPLTYSRENFLGDLTKSLEGIESTQRNAILQKLGITTIEQGGKITGYDGIIDLTKLDITNPKEAEVLNLVQHFIKNNSIKTGNAELDSALNSLIEGMPEFINIIGKQQHETQAYSVDTHILKVLQEAMANPLYDTLSDLDKTCLKFAAVLHDIAKSEGIVDKSHPLASALYTRNIMEKYTFPENISDRIYELVRNHHWLEEYNKENMTPEQIAALFRHKDDYTIGKIIAEADLKGVNDQWFDTYGGALSANMQSPVQDALFNISRTGQLMFTSKVIQQDKLPTVEYNGKTYQLIDFNSLPDNVDLYEYGFTPGTTKDNLRLYIHMAGNAQKLETVDILSDIANGGFLCASYVSLEQDATYQNMRFGVSLEAENVNIANVWRENQGSGTQKDFNSFSSIITGQAGELSTVCRSLIADSIKYTLGIDDSEYVQLYELIAAKKFLTQIPDDEVYSIGDKTLTGKQIKTAIQTADDQVLSTGTNHNESNLYNPKINAFVAKVDSIDEIPQEFLDFALAHNLPIYLLGSEN